MAEGTGTPAQDPTEPAQDAITAPEQPAAPDGWRSPLLDLGRAVAGEGDLAGVPLHFGDPSGEQWALEAGDALVDRCDLGVVTVTGPDRQSWLTSITSQVVTGTGPGDSRELLVLDPQGHIEHAAAVADDGTTARPDEQDTPVDGHRTSGGTGTSPVADDGPSEGGNHD